MTEKRYTITLEKNNEFKEIIDHSKQDKHISVFDFLKQVREQDKAFKKLKKENEELKFKLEESNSDKEYVKQVIKDRIKHYHSYSCINKTDIDNGCIGLKIELEHFYDDVEPYLEELK